MLLQIYKLIFVLIRREENYIENYNYFDIIYLNNIYVFKQYKKNI